MKHQLALLAATALFAVPAYAHAASPQVTIAARNVDGAHGEIGVRVRPSHDGSVHYHLVTLHGDASSVQLSMQHTGANVEVDATYILQRGILWFLSRDSYRLEVEVPPGSSLSLRTDVGGIDAVGTWSRVAANTGMGGVDIDGSREVEARTGNGGVRVKGAARLDARTGNGGVEATLAGTAPEATIRTGNGGISLHLASGAAPSVDARTGNGGIENPLENAKGPGHLDLRTGNGGIGITVAH